MATKKTTSDAINDLIALIEQSGIMQSLSGQIYKGFNRPIGSELEDVVVNCISSSFDQVQEFSCNINIFVKRIEGVGQNVYLQNTKRLGEVARLLSNFVENISSNEYDIKPSNAVNFEEALGINQDFVNITLRIYRISQTI